MAVAARPTETQEPLVRAVVERLAALDRGAPGDVLGPGFARYARAIEIQRVDVDEVVPLGDHAVALLYQRGRDAAGVWVERRLSAVFSAEGAVPELYPSWVAGLDAASRW
jgi:hypothetical protein